MIYLRKQDYRDALRSPLPTEIVGKMWVRPQNASLPLDVLGN